MTYYKNAERCVKVQEVLHDQETVKEMSLENPFTEITLVKIKKSSQNYKRNAHISLKVRTGDCGMNIKLEMC